MAKILSVEDEPSLQKFIEFHLKRNGHEIRVAPDGEQALAMVKSDRPDLILLDLKMPVMGGFRVLKKLKEDRATKNIPVIMLSANRKQHDIDAGLKSGVFDYVTKPFDVSNLLERIEKALASIKYPANTPQIPRKSPENNRSIANLFCAIVRDIGLPPLTFHGLRHAHATLALTAGINPKVVSERLGHSTIAVTMDIYSHVLPGMQQEAALAVEQLLNPSATD